MIGADGVEGFTVLTVQTGLVLQGTQAHGREADVGAVHVATPRLRRLAGRSAIRPPTAIGVP